MIPPRKPSSFPVAGDLKSDMDAVLPTPPDRRPRAVRPTEAVVVPAEIDYFAQVEADPASVTRTVRPAKRSKLGAIFAAALGSLVSLALGLWIDGLVRSLFERAEWLGWVAAALAAVALLSMFAIVVREMRAIWRLSSIEKLRAAAADALLHDDSRAARHVVTALTDLTSSNPATAAGRRALGALEREIIDGAGLIRLAEIEILAPLDAQARVLVVDAAKRVSVVTAVSPRALIDLLYVVYEAGRLIRRLAELYGARPGTLGFFRLARSVLAHLAVTGVVAAGDDFVHQMVGQGLAARLSAKLGEGVVNGMMTARIGIAAMETVRPLPFSALKRPKMTDVLGALTALTREKSAGGQAPRD